MFRNKMIYQVIIFVVIVIALAAVAWHFLFGMANPPLPQGTVTVTSSDAMTPVSTPSSTATTSSPAAVATSSIIATSSDDENIANPQLPTEQLNVDGAVFNVEVASTMVQQARGLSYRASLGVNDGMLFVFGSGATQSFWMKDMNFPLDMIWISGNAVVGFAQNAAAEPGVAWPTQTYSSPSSTDKVLEVNAGTVAKYNIKIGDTISIK